MSEPFFTVAHNYTVELPNPRSVAGTTLIATIPCLLHHPLHREGSKPLRLRAIGVASHPTDALIPPWQCSSSIMLHAGM